MPIPFALDARRALSVGALLCLGACQDGKPQSADLQKAETLRPADARLAEKYERSCLGCHGAAASQAPLTAFAAAWAPRLRQGMPVLLAHARDGFKTMPAMGYCNDCGDEELRRLIVFMAGAAAGARS